MSVTYRAICSWCGEEYEQEAVADSSGICPRCEEEVLEEMNDDGFCRAADAVSGYGEAN